MPDTQQTIAADWLVAQLGNWMGRIKTKTKFIWKNVK